MLHVRSSTEASESVLSLRRTGFCLRELPHMYEQDHALWRRLSQLLHCSDGSVSVALVLEFASHVLQNDILLPLCPAATEELLLLSPWRQKRSYPRSRTNLAVAATTLGMSIFLESGTVAACMAPEEVSVHTKKHAVCRGPPSLMSPELDLSCGTAASIFDGSQCGESRPRDSTHTLHQDRLGKVCQPVLIQQECLDFECCIAGRDGIGSSTRSHVCGPIGICNS